MLRTAVPTNQAATARPLLRRLKLADFRSYKALDLEVSRRFVILCGENGAGKTNILEALSLLSPGRGLRRAEAGDLARERGGGGFAVSADIEGALGGVQMGAGVAQGQDDTPKQRRYRLDREPLASARAFADHIRIVWLTPAMDGLFAGPPGERRRFLDRLVLAVDADHGARVNALDKALRNRNRLLEDGMRTGTWLDAAEREVCEIAVAVAAARRETVGRLQTTMQERRDAPSVFPWADMAIGGTLESLLAERSALDTEEAYGAILREDRHRDAAAGRTLVGPHASDLLVRHGPKNIEASRGSTGEQKALLVGLVLAHARLVGSMSGICPILLLDEVAAHFDPAQRRAMFEELAQLGAQVWATGADPAQFADLPAADIDRVRVTPGLAVRA